LPWRSAVPPRYEIRLSGEVDDASKDAFAGLEVVTSREVTVISGDLDQAALHGLLERIRVLGFELLDLRRSRGSTRPRS
jgi:hypothetical protein